MFLLEYHFMTDRKFEIHQDSTLLMNDLRGKVDWSIQYVLSALDTAQTNEDISPFLAETARDMIYQLACENPSRFHDLLIRSLDGPSIKFILSQLEDSGGNYRLRKSAELIEEYTGRNSNETILEYTKWMYSHD